MAYRERRPRVSAAERALSAAGRALISRGLAEKVGGEPSPAGLGVWGPQARVDRVSAHVVQRIQRQLQHLPAERCQTLTWDRGHEMAAHQAFTVATDIPVYVRDPQGPWRRGTTNGPRLTSPHRPGSSTTCCTDRLSPSGCARHRRRLWLQCWPSHGGLHRAM